MNRDPQRAVRAAARDVSAGDVVIIACSGGLDSATLARLAVPALLDAGAWPMLAHLDHGLRHRGGAEDARFVTRLAAGLGVPCVRRHQRPDLALRADVGPQAAARQARLAFLSAAAASHSADAIWTGHHLDDQLEGLLLRGVPMPERRDALRRPLLGVARSAIQALAIARGWTWREDPSNAHPGYGRTAARRHVAGLLDSERRVLESRAADLAAARAAAIQSAASAHRSVVISSTDDTVVLDRAAFNASAACAPDLLRALLPPARPGGRGPTPAALRFLIAVARGNDAPREAHLGAGWSAQIRRVHITLCRRKSRPSPPVVRVLRGVPASRAMDLLARCRSQAGTRFAVLDADASGPVRVTPAGTGRRIRPFGMSGTRLVRDLLAEADVPRGARAAWPVVEARDGSLLWVAGVRSSAAATLHSRSTHATLLYTVPPSIWGTSSRFDS